jgi:hypothetical protein
MDGKAKGKRESEGDGRKIFERKSLHATRLKNTKLNQLMYIAALCYLYALKLVLSVAQSNFF